MKKIMIVLAVLFGVFSAQGQNIRKSWSEFTSSEQIAYVNAINSLNSVAVNNLANEHDRLFSAGIHTTAQFLPWHRIYLKFFEEMVQAQNPDLALPYWDWYDQSSWASSSNLFEDGSGGSDGLWGFNVSSGVWPFNRSFSSSWSPPSTNMSTTDYATFSNSLEDRPHNTGHGFVGGSMMSLASPIDPLFYLHHGMVDKVWRDWYEDNPTASVAAIDNPMQTFIGYPTSTVNGQALVDPRVQELWYADDNLLILNNYTVSGSDEYTYSTGVIEVKDFTIPNNESADMTADDTYYIELQEGFLADNGATFLAEIDASLSKMDVQVLAVEDPVRSSQSGLNQALLGEIKIFPNPSVGDFAVNLKQPSNPYLSEEKVEGTSELEIYDMAGNRVHAQQITGASAVVSIGGQLARGIYSIKVQGNSIVYYGKIVLL